MSKQLYTFEFNIEIAFKFSPMFTLIFIIVLYFIVIHPIGPAKKSAEKVINLVVL